jgi:ribosome production factor 1
MRLVAFSVLLSIAQERLAKNIPRTLDNTREFDPSMLTANPAASTSAQNNDPSSSNSPQTQQPDEEAMYDISTDPFASYFDPPTTEDGSIPTPKVLITTSQKVTRVSYEFCEELVVIFPGAEFIRRKKGQGFEIGRIAGWAAKRGFSNLIVVNEDRKTPSMSFSIILSSVQLTL